MYLLYTKQKFREKSVNTFVLDAVTMKDRIKEYIEYKQITAGELAVKLDVQRSNISHILNGRNKPGAAFIEKLLIVFPDLNARWLLTGKGNMLDKAGETGTPDRNILPLATEIEQAPKPAPVAKEEIKEKTKKTERPVHKTQDEVDRMILVFTDGTFSTYKNRDKS